jgi:phosphoserine phosphatase RsbU/P
LFQRYPPPMDKDLPASAFGAKSRLDAVRRSELAQTDREPFFDELTKTVAQLLRAPYALISIMEETHSFWKSTYGLPLSMRSENVSDSFCQYVVECRAELLTDDVRNHPVTRLNPTIESKGVRGWAGCPVELDGEVLGTLCVIDSEVREWTLDDRNVLRALAAMASREITMRAQLRGAEEAVARATTESARVSLLLATIRTSLLPPLLPTITGLELEAWFCAADDSDTLLGDFYDVFPLGENRWGLVVGDVCGHGVEAAKLTSLVRYSLRSAAVRHRDPAQVMVEVDAAIRADSLNGARFATVCYFDIDTTDETVVRWARAGHPFPILLDIDGKSNYCSGAEGPPLGIAAGVGPASWTASEFTLSPGQQVLVYTDGLTDVRSSTTGAFLGEAGLLESVGRFCANTEQTTSLVSHVVQHARECFDVHGDDIALIVLRSTGFGDGLLGNMYT